MIRPVDALLDFLAAEQARGVTHVHLDEGAREALREIHALSRGGAISTPASKPASENVPQARQVSSQQASGPAPKAPTISLETPTAELTPAAIAPASISIQGSSKADQLASLKRQAENWAPAKALGSLRDTMVFATGNPDARVMLVGEAPGYQEEREQEPFVGPAGQKLNDILKAMGLSREEVYISNIVKFRPATPRQTTNNRKPTPEEMNSCISFVRAEIGIVEPECIIALGGTAAEGLLGINGSVASMRGKWHQTEGIPVRVTYHPSYLLQSGSGNHTKRQLWEDMLEVMERIQLPISEKQRGYFLPKP